MLKFIIALFLGCFVLNIHAASIQIVAAENFYGKIAEHLGGPYVEVTSLIQNPKQDPHLFSTTAHIAKKIADADIIIYNGLGYDDWVDNLIASGSKTQFTLNISKLMSRPNGSNPHIWYDPATIPVYASALYDRLIKMDPQHQPYFTHQLTIFKRNYQPLLDLIQQIKGQYSGTPVLATEPVFNDMAQALALKMQGQAFQLSIMNDTEPSVSSTQEFEDHLKNHSVKLLIYNSQVSSPLTEHMLQLAKQTHVPVVGVTETEPEELDYVAWMISQLHSLELVLES